jgi:hypothetical protein
VEPTGIIWSSTSRTGKIDPSNSLKGATAVLPFLRHGPARRLCLDAARQDLPHRRGAGASPGRRLRLGVAASADIRPGRQSAKPNRLDHIWSACSMTKRPLRAHLSGRGHHARNAARTRNSGSQFSRLQQRGSAAGLPGAVASQMARHDSDAGNLLGVLFAPHAARRLCATTDGRRHLRAPRCRLYSDHRHFSDVLGTGPRLRVCGRPRVRSEIACGGAKHREPSQSPVPSVSTSL